MRAVVCLNTSSLFPQAVLGICPSGPLLHHILTLPSVFYLIYEANVSLGTYVPPFFLLDNFDNFQGGVPLTPLI